VTTISFFVKNVSVLFFLGCGHELSGERLLSWFKLMLVFDPLWCLVLGFVGHGLMRYEAARS
jgi:hypothetical protein